MPLAGQWGTKIQAWYAAHVQRPPSEVVVMPWGNQGEHNINFRVSSGVGKTAFARVNARSTPERFTFAAREADSLRIVSRLGIAPRLLFFDRSFHGHPLILETFVEGIPVAQGHDLRSAYFQLGLVLARLHSAHLPRSFCPSGRTGRKYRDSEYRSQQKSARSASNRALGNLLYELLAVGRRAMEDLVPRVEPRDRVFLHLDVSPNNSLVTPVGVVLVDWERTDLGDRYFDLASAVYEAYDGQSMSVPSADLRSPIINGYEAGRGPRVDRDRLSAFVGLQYLWDLPWLCDRIRRQVEGTLPEFLKASPKDYEGFLTVAIRDLVTMGVLPSRTMSLLDGIHAAIWSGGA